MKQSKVFNAYLATESLKKNLNFTNKEHWELYKLRKMLKPRYDFQAERETEVRNKYKDFITPDGYILPPNAEKFAKDLMDIQEIDIDIGNIEKIHLRIVEGVTAEIMESLEDFVEFEYSEDFTENKE